MNKSAWRARLKSALTSRSAEPGEAEAIVRWLDAWPVWAGLAKGALVMAYAATGEEAPTHAALAALRQRGVTVALPVVAGGQTMEMYAVDDPAELVPDRFGVLAPPCELRTDLRRVDPARAVLALVPGLGFDEVTGVRLGRGGGFYDRYLARCPALPRVGLAFEAQVVTGLPAEPHDVPMHAVVTPRRLLRF